MSESRRGRLIAVEGIDGTGKSTLVRALATSLRRRGWSVARRHEPADPTLGALAQRAGAQDAWTGAIFFTVDRHLALRALRRDLDRHDVVLTDRSFYSTLAYQGSALPPVDRARLAELQRRASLRPDLVVLLDLAPRTALGRLQRRAGRRGPLERANLLARVAAEYRRLARRGRWIVVDAAMPRPQLTHAVVVRVERRLRPLRGAAPVRRRRRT